MYIYYIYVVILTSHHILYLSTYLYDNTISVKRKMFMFKRKNKIRIIQLYDPYPL